jgi:hypothetical protein
MLRNPSQEVHFETRAYPTLPPVGALGLAIVVGIAYFLAAQLSLALLAKPDGVAVFWPAAGFGSDFTLGRLRDVLGLLAAAVVATAASGIGGMVAYMLFHGPMAPIWTTWQRWFASDAVGIITVAPMVIGLAEAVREPPPRHEIIEGVGALLALSVITVVFAAARAAADGAPGGPVVSDPAVDYGPLPAGACGGVHRFTHDCVDDHFWARSFRGFQTSDRRPHTARSVGHPGLYAMRIRSCGVVRRAASAREHC